MTTTSAVDLIPAELVEQEERPPSAIRAVLQSTEGRIGLVLGLVVLFVIVFGRFFTPYRPNAIQVGPSATGPSWSHLLGTDALGRDVLSRLLVGGGAIILIPLVAVTIAWVLGLTLGMLGVYKGGVVDALTTRFLDLLLTLPPLLIVLTLIGGAGTSNLVLVASLVLVYTPRMGRIARGATQAVITSEYVQAAQARGERTFAILFREVLPNIISPSVADYALRITYGVIFIATLNFLGLGVQPPKADWGVMIHDHYGFFNIAPVATLAPAAAVALLSISLNLIADALTQHVTQAHREVVPL
ncbi:MAG: ABC transporter permease [Actinobacteria bacterium]|nr:MAG: ABC transporter permease [Actinomycetota bacterium]